MTNIYPNTIPSNIAEDPRREGERIVFKKLKDMKDKDFHVFYSVEWTRLKNKSLKKQDGECDFIIIHKKLGIICFEVKGGKISKKIDENGFAVFYSKDKKGEVHEIQNPYSQAKKTKNAILAEWKKFNCNSYINIQHAVIFPETMDPGEYKTINEHREITIFQDDLDHIEINVYKIFGVDFQDNFDDLDNEGINFLKEIFLSEIPLKEKLSDVIDVQKKIIEEKTKVFLDSVLMTKEAFKNKIIFQGGAGTGKTHLALEIAKSFTQNGSVLLICFNRGLKNYLKNQITNYSKIDVKSIHEVITDLDIKDFNEDEITTKILSKNFFYESIIIDEAQDFKREWWNIIFNSSNSSKSNIYIFLDSNQKIYKNSDYYDLFERNDFRKIPLSKNFRNSKNIHNLIKGFYDGSDYYCESFKGERISLVEYNNNLDLHLNELLKKLVHENGIMPNQITILTAVTLDQSYHDFLTVNSLFNFTNCESPKVNHITIDSIYRYKGLENDVVIILNLSDKDEDLNLLYTGLSRARLLLYVIDQSSLINSLKKIIDLNKNS